MTDPAASGQSSGVEVARPSFDAIYGAELGYVHGSLRRLGVRGVELEDASHDVFLVVHRRLRDYDPARPLRPWLFGIALRVAADRRRRRTTEPLEDPASLPDDRPGADETLEGADARRLVLAALATLDEDRRAVFILHDIDEVPAPQIALSLSLPLNTVYSRLRVARERFARAVERLAPRGAP